MKFRISIFIFRYNIPTIGEGINFENEILPILEILYRVSQAPLMKTVTLQTQGGIGMDGLAHLIFDG